jgi:hypothetical protein
MLPSALKMEKAESITTAISQCSHLEVLEHHSESPDFDTFDLPLFRPLMHTFLEGTVKYNWMFSAQSIIVCQV